MNKIQEEIESLYKQVYLKKVKVISRILKGDYASAEDIVQEAFTRSLKYKDVYNPQRGSLETWFNSILFNALRDFKKEQHATQELHKEIFLSDIFDVLDISDMSDYKELLSLIKFVENEKHQRVLELFFIYGFSSSEISQIEPHMSQSNVTTIIMRFRQLMKKLEDIG